jgi:hypothetical protein
MTKSLVVAGGVYRERCVWPEWDQLFGSGGRAAAATTAYVDEVVLHAYMKTAAAERFKLVASAYGFLCHPTPCEQTVAFDYVHSMSVPVIRPAPAAIRRNPPIDVTAEVVLRFGMMEGSARVSAARCVYDPQSAFVAEPFAENGSRAGRLAVVANRREVVALGGGDDPALAARTLLQNGAELVVMKSGPDGAYVVEPGGITRIPAYATPRVWTVGSGESLPRSSLRAGAF